MSTEMEVNGSPETKESESQGTENDHEKSETDTDSESEDQIEYSNVASSTTNESYPTFDILEDNIYLGNKKKRVNKEIRRMSCDCPYSPEEHDFVGCGDDCLNRLLMIECNNRCPCGESCSNRKFQEGQKIQVEAFKTDKKGWGLRTLEDVAASQFVIEYCGEVMGYEEFENRVEMYDEEHRRHYYFMTLRADEIIDATHKGNLSRFINHSCSPNCETQKWTVNGYLRIGFFSIKDIKAGTELTFDYKFQRYGKKAQICYCESLNCRGIIGGEKHTPLKLIISGRPASPAPTSSPRRNRRRRLAEQFDDKPLEIEIALLLGSEKGIKSDDQALKLSQFMVRAETQSQRLLLLDTLWATEDPNSLRSILRYQGLSLLWSWMVDLGDNSLRFQKKIVQVLKHLPVANLNQVKDTKVLKVINKWAKKPSVSCVPEEETSSSDVDSRGLSPLEIPDDTGKRDGDISSSSTEIGFDDLQSASKPKNMETQPIADDSQDTTKAKTLNENPETPTEGEGEAGVTEKPETQKPDEDKDEDNVFEEADEAKTATLKFASGENQTVCDMPVVAPGIGESSEEESRWSEDDSTSTDGENIKDLAADLLDSWRNLKEVYRIPKKSTIVVKREPESTSGAVEAVVTESSIIRHALKIPHIATIEGDLFQKDEFLSKLGEFDRKPFQQESSELPSLMSSTLPAPDPEDTAHEASKLPIHQRLQMVASGAKPPKQYPVWQEKGAKRARKHPYHAGGSGAFPSGAEKWAPRQQVAGKSRFIQPGGVAPNHPTHAGGQLRPNMGNAQWQAQDSSAYPGGFQYPPGGGPAGYPTPNPNQAAAQVAAMQSSYFTPSGPQHGQAADHALYQQAYPSTTEQSSFGPGQSKLPAQGGIQTNPLGYQQMQQPVNQPVYQMPLFDPSKPPPNFGPAQTNIPSQQFPNVAQFPNPSSQFSNSPPGYSTTPQVPGYPMQPPQAQQVSEQVMSQTSLPPAVEHSQAMGHQYPSNAVSTTSSMVSSTVNETETPKTDVGSRSEGWPIESFNKPQDVPLPSDWKKAYDGEGRAYYYHVVTRQTQWEPPAADRSPPTPELGYHGDELDSSMEMTTTFPSHITTDVVMEVVDPNKRKKPKTPSTPPGSPPKSPMGKYTTAAADTTDVRKGLYSPSLLLQGRHLTPEQRKLRETFRMKLSAVVVNYLNPYHKLDCKVGRISTVDDFKFLARKLTHGVMVKELARLKDESELVCNDSVKIKTKEYIRYYMQKFGPVYKAS